jgi:hypothetical protein
MTVTQDNSFDFGSTDPCVSPTALNLWLETDVFQLRKHCAVVWSSFVCKLIVLNFLLFSVFYLFMKKTEHFTNDQQSKEGQNNSW